MKYEKSYQLNIHSILQLLSTKTILTTLILSTKNSPILAKHSSKKLVLCTANRLRNDRRHRMKTHHHVSSQPSHYLPPDMSPLQVGFLDSSTQSAAGISCTIERTSGKELLKCPNRERKEHYFLQLYLRQINSISSEVQTF